MQNSKNGKKIIFGMIIFLITVFMIGCGNSRNYYTTTRTNIVKMSDSNDNSMDMAAPERTTTGGIEVSMNYGFNHYAKFGRYMNIRAEIAALEQDVQGVFQVVMPEQNGNNVVYEERIEAVQGKTEKVVMDIPMNGSFNQFQYKLLGESNETVIEKTVSVEYAANNEMVYIGVLSNHKDGLGYLQGANTKAFYLDEDIISDNYLSLDGLDVIVVSDYSMDKLSDSQCNSIKDWTKSGGTLVLSTDSKSMSVYTEFLGNSLLGLKEDTIFSKITFKLDNENSFDITRTNNGISDTILPTNIDFISNTQILPYKSIERELYHIDLEDSKSVSIAMGEQEDRELLQTVNLGIGMIQVFAFDIRLDEKEQETIGQKLVSSITNNMSKAKKQQLSNEINSATCDYRLLNNIELTSSENLPRVAKYIVVLLIYIIIVGPLVYIILKKKDKRNLTWIVVPTISVIFTVIVFLMGNSTRVEEPYIGYTSMIQVEEEGLAEDTTIFSITSPNNRPYDITFNSVFGVSAIVDRYTYGNNYYNDNVDYSKYNINIVNEAENTKVKIKDNSAFTPAYFMSKAKTSVDGTFEYEIYDTNDTVTGTFTNTLGYNLYHTAILCNGILIYTGDLADNEMVKVDNLEREDIPTPEVLYSSEFVDKIAGGKLDSSDTEVVRRHNILDNYIEGAIKGSENESFLIGFIEDTPSKEIFHSLNYKTYGIKSIMIPLEINQTKDGLTYINDMSTYMEVIGGHYEPVFRYISSEDLIVKYTFKPEDKIKTIKYAKRGNQEFHNKKQASFNGSAYFYNYITKEYDKIFTGGEEKEVNELSHYLNGKNELLMKVKVKQDAESRYGVTLPMLTAVKEAD